jgi:hypothetical protein
MKFFCGKYFLLALAIFLGTGFFVGDAIAANCPSGKTGTCVQGSENCPPERNIGLCDDHASTCCAPATSGTCTGAGKTCRSACLNGEISSAGTCPIAGNVCCASQTTGGSCTGGSCVKSGDPCPSGTTSQGACSAAEGGGTCCKKPTDGGGGNMVSIDFKNPLAYDTVEGVLDSILGTLRAIIVTLALVFLVVGAVLYITSAGSEKQMKVAKGAIVAAMIGLAIGLAAPSFLKEISQVLGWTSVNNPDVSGALTLSQIALNVLYFLLSVVGILAIIMLVVGGIIYMTGATTGDEKSKVQTGKNIIKYAIIGIFVALASLVIVSQIAEFFM